MSWWQYKPVVTVVDLVEAGACFGGVKTAIAKYRVISIEIAQAKCRSDELMWLQKAGYGDGDGDGDAYGYGYGSYGYGYGSYGYGYGYGDGSYGYGSYGDGSCGYGEISENQEATF